MFPNLIEIARETFDLPTEADAERRLKIFLRAVADTVAKGASDPAFSLRLHPIGTFKTESRPARKRINPRTRKLFFTPPQTRVIFELSASLNKAGKPSATELG